MNALKIVQIKKKIFKEFANGKIVMKIARNKIILTVHMNVKGKKYIGKIINV